MPRASGQIDLSKSEAILDAALEVLAERGFSASMEEIARRARVSKQTIYNHYGSKAELVRALTRKRRLELTAPLQMPGAVERPRATLAGLARGMLTGFLAPHRVAFLRMAIVGAQELPEVAAVIHGGTTKTCRKLAAFLEREMAAGRLACPDPLQAAEFFHGMVVGPYQTAALLGIELPLDEARIERIADEAAARFLRAYAP